MKSNITPGMASGIAGLVEQIGDLQTEEKNKKEEVDKYRKWWLNEKEEGEKKILENENLIIELKARHSDHSLLLETNLGNKIGELEEQLSGIYAGLLEIVRNSKNKGYKPEKDLELVKGLINTIEEKK